MKTVEISFDGLRRTKDGRKVLSRLITGGYNAGRPGAIEAYKAYISYIKEGNVTSNLQRYISDARVEYSKLPANGRATLKGALAATEGDFDHIISFSNLKSKGQHIGHRNPNNMAGFGKLSLNRARGSRDMHYLEVKGVKDNARRKAWEAVAEEKGANYANAVNEKAKREIKLKQPRKIYLDVEVETPELERILKQAFEEASEVAIKSYVVNTAVDIIVDIALEIPKLLRGNITRSQFERKIGYIAADKYLVNIRPSLILGAISFGLQIIFALFTPPLWIITLIDKALPFVNLALRAFKFLRNSDKFIEYIEELKEAYGSRCVLGGVNNLKIEEIEAQVQKTAYKLANNKERYLSNTLRLKQSTMEEIKEYNKLISETRDITTLRRNVIKMISRLSGLKQTIKQEHNKITFQELIIQPFKDVFDKIISIIKYREMQNQEVQSWDSQRTNGKHSIFKTIKNILTGIFDRIKECFR